jgi:parvulin-like peptidyl-prolyl isomerase
MKKKSFVFAMLAAAIGSLSAYPLQPADAADGADVFATVDGESITKQEFEREVYSAARQTYYHGRPPGEEEYIEFRKGVADRLIERRLLLEEAERRKLEPDTVAIDARIAQYEARYGDTERWQMQGASMVAALRERFEQDSLLESIESEVRRVDAPDEAVLRAFYHDKPELFTEPAQNRIAVILLGVAPSAGAAPWQAARDEAARIADRLAEGADFAELAGLHSSDSTAEKGGDMGYLHEGMLSPDAEAAVAKLDVGGISEPVRVLEGIAIFKFVDRRSEELRSFTDVRGRAEDLWVRQAGEARWQQLVSDLRAESEIYVDTDYLVSVPDYDE